MCFIHSTSSCSGKFVIMSSSRFVARFATVQALYSMTNQVHELHRLDEIGVPHQVFLSTQSTLLYVVMVSCNTASDVSSASPAMYTTSHSRVKLNGRLAGIISLLALGFART